MGLVEFNATCLPSAGPVDLHRRGHLVDNRHLYHLRRDIILGSPRFGDRLFDSGLQHLWLQLVLGEPPQGGVVA